MGVTWRSTGSEVRSENVWGVEETDWQEGRTRESTERDSIWGWTGITEKDSWTQERTSKVHSDIIFKDGFGGGWGFVQVWKVDENNVGSNPYYGLTSD